MANWSQNSNRSSKRYPRRSAKRSIGTPHISRFLWRIAKPAMRRRGFSDQTLIEHWPTIMGAQLATLSQPMRLSRKAARHHGGTGEGGEGGVLTIKVEGAMALELQHLAPQIIDRLNSFYGHAAIAKLNIVQGPVHRRPRPDIQPPPKAEEVKAVAEEMEDISSPRLKNALARLSLRLKKRLNNRLDNKPK